MHKNKNTKKPKDRVSQFAVRSHQSIGRELALDRARFALTERGRAASIARPGGSRLALNCKYTHHHDENI
jgi:hypothetical protein